MKCLAIALLCFSLLFPAAWAADPAPPSPTDTYILARDRTIAEFTGTNGIEEAWPKHQRALETLAEQILTLVPPWIGPGFPPKGALSLETLDRHDLGFGLLDGVVYKSGETTVLVTTVPLLKRWLRDNRHPPNEQERMPSTIQAALRSATFYSWAIAEDAAAEFYGTIPVTSREPLAFVQLVTFAQEDVEDAPPAEIIAAAVRGDRVFIGAKAIETKLKPAEACKPALDRAHARADASVTNDPKHSRDTYVRIIQQADRQYRRCFIASTAKAPEWKPLQREAQALVDLLH